MINKRLWLFRGIPGSGKSTAAHYAANGNPVFSADMFFETYESGEMVYKFDRSKIRQAHENCHALTEQAMLGNVSDIYVTNTFTQDWELENYFQLAKSYEYTVFSMIIENRHGSENIHGCPAETVKEMRDRFSVKL